MWTMKEINKEIGVARRSTAALRTRIHNILCNCAGHAYQHGDVTAFTRLFASVSGTDRHAIGKWVADFGFAKLNKDGTFSLNKTGVKNADFADGNAVVAYLTTEVDPWYAYVKSGSQVAADLDVEKQINSLIKRIKKARDEGDRDVIIPYGTRKAMAELGGLLGDIQCERQESNRVAPTQLGGVLGIAAE